MHARAAHRLLDEHDLADRALLAVIPAWAAVMSMHFAGIDIATGVLRLANMLACLALLWSLYTSHRLGADFNLPRCPPVNSWLGRPRDTPVTEREQHLLRLASWLAGGPLLATVVLVLAGVLPEAAAIPCFLAVAVLTVQTSLSSLGRSEQRRVDALILRR